MGATLCWALVDRLQIRVAYALPVGGDGIRRVDRRAVQRVSRRSGCVAVVQDLVLLGWATTVVTVCRTPNGLSLVLRTWAYASVVWARLMMLGALTNIDRAVGNHRTRREPRVDHVRRSQHGGRLLLLEPDGRVGLGDTAAPGSRACAAVAILLAAIIFTGSNGFTIATLAACAVAAFIGMARRRGSFRRWGWRAAFALVGGAIGSQLNVTTRCQ